MDTPAPLCGNKKCSIPFIRIRLWPDRAGGIVDDVCGWMNASDFLLCSFHVSPRQTRSAFLSHTLHYYTPTAALLLMVIFYAHLLDPILACAA